MAAARHLLRHRTVRRTFGERVRLFFRIVRWLMVLGGIGALVGWWYLHRVGTVAERQFSRSFRWDLPSRIYADVEYLYPGLDITLRHLRDKLDRLGYRDTAASVLAAGEYAFLGNTIEIFLHDFDYPNSTFTGFPVRLVLQGSEISAILRIDTDESLPTVRLEPELIARVFDARMEDRTLVKLREVPDACLQAVVLIEDERFFQHHGVDPVGIARAMVANLKALRIKQGGSTLTQQLVKNYFLTQERSVKRKVTEALMALALERRHTKGEILEAYLNEIYLGQRGQSSVSGFGEAARLYFGKNIDQLAVDECALLAGMIRAPHRYSPFHQPLPAVARRDFVLARLHAARLIDERVYQEARATKIITPKRAKRTVNAPYFIDFVKQQLLLLYPDTQLSAEGLRIFTTLDMTSQRIAEDAVSTGLAELEKKYAHILPTNHTAPLQGALVSIHPQTGYIRSLVGGRSYKDTKFNRITQALRQPGSIFKPFVYLTAFDPDRADILYAPSSYVHDISFTTEAGGTAWTPKNYDKKEHGPVTAREALTHSYNIATARIAMDAGLPAVVQTARDAGITGALLPVPAIALGAFEVTPLEMASAYTIFANNGIRAEPLSIMHVVDKNGKVLERRSIAMKRTFAPGPVYLVTHVLKDVLDRGTAASARTLGFSGVAAGKTGTTSSYRDAWFVGFTPDTLALTWVGYDDNTTTNMSGGRAALPIWTDFMKRTVGNPRQDFPVPKGIVLVSIDPASGKASTPRCGVAFFEPFVEGGEPQESCPLH